MRYINGWTVVETNNGKVVSFATGDDRAGGQWDHYDSKENKKWLFECIHKLSWRDYLAFKKDVSKEFIDWLENKVQEE